MRAKPFCFAPPHPETLTRPVDHVAVLVVPEGQAPENKRTGKLLDDRYRRLVDFAPRSPGSSPPVDRAHFADVTLAGVDGVVAVKGAVVLEDRGGGGDFSL